MKALELYQIDKPYFGYEEIARFFGISPASARVSASRYVKQGLLLRLKRNLYVLRQEWDRADRADRFRLANLIQTPSYISLMTALDHYGITTQIQRDFFESIAVKRTREIQADGTVFRYTRINEKLYFSFKKEQGFFIASPEKALLDIFYLMSYGRYSADMAALDAGKLDKQAIKRLCKKFPPRTQNLLGRYGYLQGA